MASACEQASSLAGRGAYGGDGPLRLFRWRQGLGYSFCRAVRGVAAHGKTSGLIADFVFSVPAPVFRVQAKRFGGSHDAAPTGNLSAACCILASRFANRFLMRFSQ